MAQKQYPIINNFSRGELSARMEGRVEIQDYYNGCKTMQNAIMVAQGGFEKRPGTIYLDSAYDPDGFATKVRLIPFEVNDDEIYILELGHKATRIWNVQTKTLVEQSGTTLVLNTPYVEDRLRDIQFAQTEGRMYLVHNLYAIRYISKDDDGFKLNKEEFPVSEHVVGASYSYGEYVFEPTLKEYFMCLRTTTQTPTVGEWQNSVFIGDTPSGTITDYNGGNFSAGEYKIYQGTLYKARKSYMGGGNCFPLIGIQVMGDWVRGRDRTLWVPWSDLKCKSHFLGICTSWESPFAHVKRTHEGPNTRVSARGVGSIDLFGVGAWVYFRVDTRTPVLSEETTDPYWKTLVGIPGGSSTLSIYEHDGTIGTSYNKGDVVYSGTTYMLYECLADGTNAIPSMAPDWKLMSNNPFFTFDKDYPSAVTFMDRRLLLGGTRSHPQTIFASRIAQYNNFNLGTNDDDAYSFELAADRSSRIKWMIAKDVLTIGTTSSEWLISGGGAPITPTNIQVLRQSAYGSEYQQAVFVADSLLFFQKGGKKLREYMYSNDNKAYLANDLTFFADHITETGIIQTSYQYNPDSILWSVKVNGDLIGLTYDRINKIAGWHRHNTDGSFESVCAIDGEGQEDELWFSVRRKVNGVYKRYIEYMAPRIISNRTVDIFCDSAATFSAGDNYNITSIAYDATPKVVVTIDGTATFANGDLVKIYNTESDLFDYQVFVVDNLVSNSFDLLKEDLSQFEPAPFTTITKGNLDQVAYIVTGLDHLLGSIVSILGDRAVFANQEVASDVDGLGGVGIILSSPCNKVVCGLPYIMRVEPESIEIPGGGTLSSARRVSKATLRLYNSLGGYVGTDDKNLEELSYRTTDIPFGAPTPLFTGSKYVPIDSSSEKEASVLIYHDQPLPMTVLAIISDITYSRS